MSAEHSDARVTGLEPAGTWSIVPGMDHRSILLDHIQEQVGGAFGPFEVSHPVPGIETIYELRNAFHGLDQSGCLDRPVEEILGAVFVGVLLLL